MSFHINTAGEVGPCTAEIRCPFGDFETEHYTTEAEARRAYEAAMAGEAFKPGLVTKPSKREQKRSKFLNKKHKQVKKILENRPPLPSVGVGFYGKASALVRLRKHDRFLGGRVTKLTDEGDTLNPIRKIHVKFPSPDSAAPETEEVYTLAMDKDFNLRNPEEKIWINQPSPEDIAAREVEAKELSLELAREVLCADVKRSFGITSISYVYTDSDDGSETELHWSPKRELSQQLRLYTAMVNDAKKANVANPHSFALARYSKTVPDPDPYDSVWRESNGPMFAAKTLRNILNQETRPSRIDNAVVAFAFDPGERPWRDYNFSETGTKVT